ncbi:MAG: hypothetical protein A3F33_02390 [Candidatus Woykebacteria bacterium RIFCSPHIGHO2_12_FULL_43_10]|uniref:Uncharacterized protein n=2 Tax=Candidatus Woykeibacteriota TaxID=1817899 RepID=A0A1G1WVB1_9BACT|nr:MAG: hypothetical protein A2802_00875 [Candidatus Woykebacteria bacterium RIFCSPHIGHO2_01_FULL_43_29]OGY28477.1 MAG: hypothetical protein A3J50_00440 [Candidatus Woykebacteria bacterium RIFCSPHIGHO2_02_FULL_43_16b]OGY28822.1 MAG: hypothetical protein A3F33_02390 [Candidatus Woykebacteria bacterium RIFCSPHIGHO2_12_FULL_43_10]OGY31097.1 MAG: hypothetical protein A3A61_04030 [Candidatus Woykebacteria bacterium RIFCSPLOWO2_01_FULL_43_14]
MQEFQRGSPLETPLFLAGVFRAKDPLGDFGSAKSQTTTLSAQKNKPSSLEKRTDSGQARMTGKRDRAEAYHTTQVAARLSLREPEGSSEPRTA